jgi:hypothetical protein
MLKTPTAGKKTKAAAKKPHAMEIHESLESMGLFELSVRTLMPADVFHELKRRVKLIQAHLEAGETGPALEAANSLLKNPQETRKQACK